MTACRRPPRLGEIKAAWLPAVCALLVVACGGASASRDGRDPLRDALRAQARPSDNATAQQRADAVSAQIWLCLLHRGDAAACRPDPTDGSPRSLLQRAARLDPTLATEPVQAAWGRALLLAAGLDGRAQAAAWATVARLADATQPGGALVHARALDALAAMRAVDAAAARAALDGLAVDARALAPAGLALVAARRQAGLPPPKGALVWQEVQATVAPLSRRPRLALARALAAGALPGPAGRTQALAPGPRGAVRVPAQVPGLHQLTWLLRLERPATVALRLTTARDAGLWLDGRPLDAAARAGRAPVSLTAGTHTLTALVAVMADGEPVALDGWRLEGAAEAAAVRAAWRPPAWDQRMLAGLLGGVVLSGGEALSVGSALAHTVFAGRAEDAPVEALERLLSALPTEAGPALLRARYAVARGRPRLAARLLSALPTEAGPATAKRADLWLLRAELALLDGLGDHALRAAQAAVAAQPQDCAVLDAALDVALDAIARPQTRALLAARPEACLSPTVARAMAMVGALEDALAAWAGLAKSPHLRQTAARAQVALLDAMGRPVPGAVAAALPEVERRWRQAQRQLSAGPAPPGPVEPKTRGGAAAADRALAALLAAGASEPETLRSALALGAEPPWQALVVDGRQAVRRATVPEGPSALEVLVDQELVWLLPDGSALRRVHQVVRVLDAAAAGSVGEVHVPVDGVLLVARTLLPDGREIAPASTPEKETVSLRGVLPGRAVEMVAVRRVAIDDVASGALRLPTFFFGGALGPSRRVEYAVISADPDPPTWILGDGVGAPVASRLRIGGQHVWRWRFDDLPRLRAEPWAHQPAAHRPSVQVVRGNTAASVADPMLEALLAYRELDSEPLDRAAALFGRLAAEATAARTEVGGEGHATAKPSATAKPETTTKPDTTALQRFVSRLFERVGEARPGQIPGSPAAALANGEGDRASLLYEIARRGGVAACLVRVRPLSHTPPRAPHDPNDYSLSAVRLNLPPPLGQVWIDPGVEGAPLGYLRPGLRDRDALLLGCGLRAEQIRTPSLGIERDRRVLDGKLVWAADGALSGQVEEVLDGAMAGLVRRLLREREDVEREALLVELSGASFPGAVLGLQGITGLDAAVGPLTLRYTVQAPASSTRERSLALALAPENLAASYARLPDRTTPMRFVHALRSEVTLHIDVRGVAVAPPAEVATIEHPRVRHERQATRSADGRRVTLRRTLQTSMGVVPARDYPLFAETLRQADRHDRIQLSRQSSEPAPARAPNTPRQP